MTDLTLSRRAVTRAIATLPVVAAVPVIAATDDPDAAIKAAWVRRQNAFTEYMDLPSAIGPRMYTAEQQKRWDIIDQCEEEIRAHVAQTPAGVSIQLWTALCHIEHERVDEMPAYHGDLSHFAGKETDFDWSTRLLLSTLRSLQAMGGVA